MEESFDDDGWFKETKVGEAKVGEAKVGKEAQVGEAKIKRGDGLKALNPRQDA